MKKSILFVAVLAAISFTSCKKDRNCTCVQTNSDGGTGDAYITTYTKSKKSDARANCLSTSVIEDDGSTTTTTCTLK